MRKHRRAHPSSILLLHPHQAVIQSCCCLSPCSCSHSYPLFSSLLSIAPFCVSRPQSSSQKSSQRSHGNQSPYSAPENVFDKHPASKVPLIRIWTAKPMNKDIAAAGREGGRGDTLWMCTCAHQTLTIRVCAYDAAGGSPLRVQPTDQRTGGSELGPPP